MLRIKPIQIIAFMLLWLFATAVGVLIGRTQWAQAVEKQNTKLDGMPDPLPIRGYYMAHLCEALGLGAGDPRCQEGAVVYAADLRADILTYLQNLPDGRANYDEIHRVFGRLMETDSINGECTPLYVNTGRDEPFVCTYDLSVDDSMTLKFYFHRDGRLDYYQAFLSGWGLVDGYRF